MVSRDPDETLRLAACAQLGSTLLQTCPVPTLIAIYGLDGKSERLDALRARALKRPSDEWSTGWGIKELAERHRTLTWPRDRLFKPALAFLRSTTVAVPSKLGALISSTPSASKGSLPSVEANQAPIPRQAMAPPSNTLLSTEHATESLHASASAGGGVWGTAEPPRVGTPSLAPGKHSVETVADLGTDVLTLACLGMGVLEKSWGEEDQTPHPRPASDLKPQAKHGAWAATHMLYAKHELVWLRDLETYVATVIALVIGRYVRQFKHFVYASTLCCVLLLLAVSSYSFEPRRVLMTCIWLLMAAVVSLTLLVYIGLDRNTLLSHISGSSPNRVTLSSAVLWRGMVWVVFPVLGVVAAQYPDLVNAVYGMFEPLVRTMH
jgi:hypothetical protein